MAITAEQPYQRPISPVEWTHLTSPAESSMTLQLFVEGTGVIEPRRQAGSQGEVLG